MLQTQQNVNLSLFDMIVGINESKILTKHVPCIVGELGGVEYALRCTLILTSDIVLGAYVIDKNHRYVIWVWSSFPPF